ncbi:ATPase domain-containing protein [Halorussus marinus]|uniref:ATPase domain-containing protein n=1 Tax=Halorussus marinus TaxID=2505976 RepID=UPI001092B6BB|nr:ATPase domain-containing protein [Halorussus marinus]
MTDATGSTVLDRALNGGLPEGRTVLVTGGPGTGKSTLGMQFLQAGLEAGERCLFVSTEQTDEEVRASFESFAFDLDHPDLTLTSLHARSGETLEDDEEVLTLQTLDGGPTLDDNYAAPFEPQYIVEELSSYGPVDRVVLDSVSGLSAMGEDYDTYRRAVFDLVRLFNDEFGATAMLTAEQSEATGSVEGTQSVAASDAIQFNTHGVIRLWRENVEGDYHRFVEVMKMRGVDHDTRVFELGFDDAGLRTYPRMRTHPGEFRPDEYFETGIEGLDALMGGGVALGGSLLLQHDGQASPHSVLTNLIARAIEADMSILIVPPVELPPKRLRSIIDERVGYMDDLLNDDRLFLLDYTNIWENTRRNVFKPVAHDDETTESVFRTVQDRSADRPVLSLVNIEAQLPVLDEDELRRVRFWEEENFYRPGDTSVYFFNPKTVGEELSMFYKNGAWQVLRTWIDATGLQYVKLEKSPSGYMGSTRLVEYTDDEPYMTVQSPPRPADGGGR